MRDAFGGITSLAIIVVFLVLVSGYLAFNVNYTKAFRVKNKIVSMFEQYEGNCGNRGPSTQECDAKIDEYIQNIGYSAPYLTNVNQTSLVCPTVGCVSGCSQKGYCWMKVDVTTATDIEDKAYYKIATQINMDIPIINKIMPGLKIFQITGDTRTIITAD